MLASLPRHSRGAVARREVAAGPPCARDDCRAERYVARGYVQLKLEPQLCGGCDSVLDRVEQDVDIKRLGDDVTHPEARERARQGRVD